MLNSTLRYKKEERMYLASPGYEIIDLMREVEGGRSYPFRVVCNLIHTIVRIWCST